MFGQESWEYSVGHLVGTSMLPCRTRSANRGPYPSEATFGMVAKLAAVTAKMTDMVFVAPNRSARMPPSKFVIV